METQDTFHELTLPSKCLPYPPGTKVEARVMRGSDEKVLAEMTTMNFEKQSALLLKRIVRGIEVEDLTLGDRLSILIWNTINSYTPDYPIDAICNDCLRKTEDVIIKLSDLETQDLPDNYAEPHPVELPKSGMSLKMRLYRIKDELQLLKYEKEATSEHDDPWLYKLALSIVSEESVWDRVTMLKGLVTQDLAILRAFHEKYIHGMILRAKFTCKHCEEESPTEVPFRHQLFVPDGKTVATALGAKLQPNVLSAPADPVSGGS